MSYNLEVQHEAVIDLHEAFEWYETQREGLGFEFIGEVENAYQNLSKNPQHYTAINERYRRLKISRFPYLIVYEIVESRIIINAVRHVSKKPRH